MELFEALRTRRSIRKYTAEDVNDDDLRTILEIAMLAPSARNEQPWRFVAVRDRGQKELLSKTTPYTHMAADAPLVIVVCADMTDDKADGMWPQDCAAAIENMMLAGRGLNLGCVWCGVHPVAEREEHVRKVLNLPTEIVPFGLVCIGHPAQPFKEENRYKEAFVHKDRW